MYYCSQKTRNTTADMCNAFFHGLFYEHTPAYIPIAFIYTILLLHLCVSFLHLSFSLWLPIYYLALLLGFTLQFAIASLLKDFYIA